MSESSNDRLPGLGSTYGLSDFAAEDVSADLAEVTTALYDGERRMDERLAMRGCKLLVRRISEDQDAWRVTEPVNFSRGGAQFITDHEFRPNERLWLNVETAQAVTGLDPFFLGAEVRHVAPHGNRFRIGVQFRLDMIKDMRRVHAEHAISRFEGFLSALSIIE